MLKKLSVSLIIATSTLFGAVNAPILKKAYEDGIYDTLSVLKNESKYAINQKITLNGYMVYINTKNLTLPDIVKYKALGLKLAFNPIETKSGLLIFAVNERRPDAFLNAQIIANHSNLHPLIKEVTNYTVTYSGVLQRYFQNKMPDKVFLIEEKITNCPVRQRIIKSDTTKTEIKKVVARGKFYLVNRVLTPEALREFCKNNPNNCDAKLNISKGETCLTERKIKRTLGRVDFSDLNNKTFEQVAGIIAHYGAVKDGELWLGKRIYKKGDKIGRFYLLNIVKNDKGVVIVTISKKPQPQSANDIKNITTR
ncbi:hypothetical protein [Caminibacter pacificus]|uniref:Uncharacterized protein n=1 Tax=Caminibacter pacificus TaxID=1424653 RepID=A0AAJ4RB86_9BACT|nr:hypothetical protein [Caminibacter pacificus]QDD68224.1 hypothetical protein C6V80_10235 [Caminibacter pacificus]ROR38738.1 hypothetical protein EDC58_1953 [Caminibacter pacificus]